jgi:hypothetical protein
VPARVRARDIASPVVRVFTGNRMRFPVSIR